MAQRIALDHHDLAAAVHVVPVLAMATTWVVALEDIGVPGLDVGLAHLRALHRRIAAIDELGFVAKPAHRAVNAYHLNTIINTL